MRKVLLAAAVVAVAATAIEGCGQSSATFIGANGGEVCIEGKVCITIPPGALADQVLVKITEGAEAPAAAIGGSYEIAPSGTQFLKAATVSIRYDFLDDDSGVDPFILRVFTKENGDWVPLGSSVVDRVRTQVTGKVTHLSPFVLLRSDLLPDGGTPIDFDAGQMDSGGPIIPPPPPDGGYKDSGMPAPDAGRPDAGPPDAGRADAGPPDAGPPDAGPPDAGRPDAGPPDAGPPDAGPPDAGPPDAGPPDAGAPDAGDDAGDLDAGDGG